MLAPDVRALVASMKIYYIIKAALQDSASVLMAEAAAIALAAAITAQLGFHDTNFLFFYNGNKSSSFIVPLEGRQTNYYKLTLNKRTNLDVRGDKRNSTHKKQTETCTRLYKPA